MVFVTCTRFELNENVLFDVGGRFLHNWKYDGRLLDAVQFVLQAPRHRQSTWGRVKEHPERIILICTWETQDSFKAFKATSEYFQYWTGLSDISSVTPTEQYIEDRFLWPAGIGVVDLFTFLVPSPVSDETREDFRKGKNSLENGGYSGSFTHQNLVPYYQKPTKVWLLGTREVDGTKVETVLHFCFWASEKKEKEFKEMKRWGDKQTRFEIYKKRAQINGAICIEEEHCDFRNISLRIL